MKKNVIESVIPERVFGLDKFTANTSAYAESLLLNLRRFLVLPKINSEQSIVTECGSFVAQRRRDGGNPRTKARKNRSAALGKKSYWLIMADSESSSRRKTREVHCLPENRRELLFFVRKRSAYLLLVRYTSNCYPGEAEIKKTCENCQPSTWYGLAPT